MERGAKADTSALPPTADLRVSMSAFTPVSSASPSGADLASSIAKCLFLTQRRHRSRFEFVNSNSTGIPAIEATRVDHRAPNSQGSGKFRAPQGKGKANMEHLPLTHASSLFSNAALGVQSPWATPFCKARARRRR